ncbi:glycosyltransferase, partial [Escherichia coli]
MRKKLSIVTVVYNGERFIENAINSVISQKNEQVEYIIVDGGSTDSTLNIIEKYKNKIDIFIS